MPKKGEKKVSVNAPETTMVVSEMPGDENDVIDVQAVSREDLDNLKADVEFLSATVADLLARVDKPTNTVAAAAVSSDAEPQVIKAEEKLSDVSALVHEILGAEFSSTVEPSQVGVSFIVKIFPPAHLCEREGDMRAKVISNIDGLIGVRAYCEKVKAHIISWAHKNGKVYVSA